MNFKTFKDLHLQNKPLLLANVWNAHSAQLAEKIGFKALGTSSHAISNSLGLEDGNNLQFDQLLFFVDAITSKVQIPVSVDIESGYGNNPQQILENIEKLFRIGVVGINIEDSEFIDGERKLVDASTFEKQLREICDKLKENNIRLFVNVRTDTYVTKHHQALEESLKRAKLYQEAGADGMFIPLIEKPADIKSYLEEISIPLNVFLKKGSPSYEEFSQMGVHRVSSGDAVYAKAFHFIEESFKQLYNQHTLD